MLPVTEELLFRSYLSVYRQVFCSILIVSDSRELNLNEEAFAEYLDDVGRIPGGEDVRDYRKILFYTCHFGCYSGRVLSNMRNVDGAHEFRRCKKECEHNANIPQRSVSRYFF